MITDEYRNQLAKMHREDPRWGITAHKYAGVIHELAGRHAVKTVLDFGCGKQVLASSLAGTDYRIIGYDPGIPGLDSLPKRPCDMLVSCDVLEHIEPACLDQTLDEMRKLFTRIAFLVIALYPVDRKLPDGRGAHLIVEPADWWESKLRERFPGCTLTTVWDDPEPERIDHTGRVRPKKPCYKVIVECP